MFSYSEVVAFHQPLGGGDDDREVTYRVVNELDWEVSLGEIPASLEEVKACLKTVEGVRWTIAKEGKRNTAVGGSRLSVIQRGCSEVQVVRVAFRLICIGAVLAAAAVIWADDQAHMHAWLAYWHHMGQLHPTYAAEETKYDVAAVAPWLVTAVLQAITIRRQSIALDCVRIFALLAACLSIYSWWPELQFWRAMGDGPFGDWVQGDFDGGLDKILSYPVCFSTLFAVVLNRMNAHLFSGQAVPIK